jgi:hypothetical protein
MGRGMHRRADDIHRADRSFGKRIPPHLFVLAAVPPYNPSPRILCWVLGLQHQRPEIDGEPGSVGPKRQPRAAFFALCRMATSFLGNPPYTHVPPTAIHSGR